MPVISHVMRFSMAALAIAVLAQPVFAITEPVVVRLADGRRVKAQIDHRTDGDQLWLITLLAGGHVSQSISWDDVLELEVAGENVDGRVAQAAVATLRDQELPDKDEAESRRPIKLEIGPAAENRALNRPAELRADARRQSPGSRVDAMALSAWHSNWDQDIVDDGLVVELVPYDAYGNSAVCDGVVDFTLRAWKESVHESGLGTRTERWTRVVRAADFESGRVLFRLPFRVIEPHQSSQWWARGALEVRLTVPGSGVVERTVTDLRLRPLEPMRDALEQREGRRYLSSENVRREAWSVP